MSESDFEGFFADGTSEIRLLNFSCFDTTYSGKDTSSNSGRNLSYELKRLFPFRSVFFMYSNEVRFSVSNSVWAIDFILRC